VTRRSAATVPDTGGTLLAEHVDRPPDDDARDEPRVGVQARYAGSSLVLDLLIQSQTI
jgi:hypothetical protein